MEYTKNEDAGSRRASKLDGILALAEKGAHIVLTKGKRPIVPKWQKVPATAEEIRRHYGQPGAQFGIVPSSIGCIVLDVDFPKGEITKEQAEQWHKDRSALMAAHEPLSYYETPGKGWHLYYTADATKVIGQSPWTYKTLSGDIRYDKGQVVIYSPGMAALALWSVSAPEGESRPAPPWVSTSSAPAKPTSEGLAERPEIRDLRQLLGDALQFRSNQWEGPCPVCGGEDRFYIHADLSAFYCRKCCPDTKTDEHRHNARKILELVRPAFVRQEWVTTDTAEQDTPRIRSQNGTADIDVALSFLEYCEERGTHWGFVGLEKSGYTMRYERGWKRCNSIELQNAVIRFLLDPRSGKLARSVHKARAVASAVRMLRPYRPDELDTHGGLWALPEGGKVLDVRNPAVPRVIDNEPGLLITSGPFACLPEPLTDWGNSQLPESIAEALRVWTRNDAEAQEFLLRSAAESLKGRPQDAKKILLLKGSKDSGKSTWCNFLARNIFGAYAGRLKRKSIMKTGGNRLENFDLADVRNKLLAIVPEVNDGKVDRNVIKELMGGEGIKERQMYSSFETFPARASLLMSCNSLPNIDGVKTRIRVIDFFKADRVKVNPNFRRDCLEPHAPALFAFLLRKLRDWSR